MQLMAVGAHTITTQNRCREPGQIADRARRCGGSSGGAPQLHSAFHFVCCLFPWFGLGEYAMQYRIRSLAGLLRGWLSDKARFRMNEQYAQIMTTFPLLHGLTQHGAEMLLAAGEIKVYSPGQSLCKEGDPASFTLLVLAGKVEVFLQRNGRDVLLREVEAGTILGELGVLCGMPRTASLRSSGESAVVQWGTAEFRRLLLRNPNLSDRITAQSLRSLIEKERYLIESMPPEQAGE
jgi:hypothetical protein